MQDRLLNSFSIKRLSVVLDILVPFLLYYSMNSHNQIMSWILVGIIVIIRILLVLVSK